MNRLTDARLELLQRRLSRVDRSTTATARTARCDDALTTAERRMWRIHELDPTSISHNIALVLTFDGAYTVEQVVASFELMVRNAVVLSSRVVVDADGAPRRERVEPAGRWIEPGKTWQFGDGDETSTDVHVVAATLAKAPFELTAEPPVRARIQASDSGAVTVVMVVHHLAVDDSSWPILLGTLVSGTWTEATSRPATGTGDVDAALRHALATWAADDVRYPLSGSLPSEDAAESWLSPLVDARGDRIDNPIDATRLAALEPVTHEVGATSNALLVAVSAMCVYAVTGAADHVLLVPADNRRPGESPSTVGYSGNIVPMRFSLDPASSVRDALRAAVGVVYGAMEFSTVDYGAVLTALRAAGGRFPVAEIMVSVRTAPLRGIAVPDGARVTCESVFNGVGNYPITMAFEIAPDDSVHLEVDYQPDVVDKTLAGHAADVVAALIEQIPSALDRTLDELVALVRRAEEA